MYTKYCLISKSYLSISGRGGGGGGGGGGVTKFLSVFFCCLHGICPQKTFLRYCQSAIATGEAHDLPGDTVADTVLKCYYEI